MLSVLASLTAGDVNLITDPRAAAVEYKEKESRYHYASGFGYYKSIKDNGPALFAEEIPNGIFEQCKF